jgi:hypothetical protein
MLDLQVSATVESINTMLNEALMMSSIKAVAPMSIDPGMMAATFN